MTKEEFIKLMKMDKHFEDSNIQLPLPGEKARPFKVLSDSTKDVFLLDTDRKSSITLTKKKLQKRHVNTGTMMVRLEIDCRPHMFNNGTFSSRNHIHIFDEKEGATVLDLENGYDKLFTDTDDFLTVFLDFCKFCNISTHNLPMQGVI